MMIIHVLSSRDGSTNQSIYRDSKRLARGQMQVRHVPHAAERTFTVLMSSCDPAGLRVDWRRGRRILAPSEPDTRTLLAAASSAARLALPRALALHGAVSKIAVLRVVGPAHMSVWPCGCTDRRNIPV